MKAIKVYTTTYCIYCVRAKKMLNDLGLPFEEINVEDDDAKRDWLVGATGRTTVPQIFIGDESIGGFTDLAALHKRGQLMTKVENAG